MTSGIDLETRLSAYLELRTALGARMDRDGRVLQDFVQFIQDRGAIASITSKMVFDWLEATNKPGTRATAQRLSSVRQFLFYVSAAVPDTQVPELRLLAGYRRPTPFLFTSEEIEALLKSAAEFEPGRFSSVVLHTALGLLAATGLRVSEALGLDRSDVMPRSSPDTLLIREAKFHKSRIALSFAARRARAVLVVAGRTCRTRRIVKVRLHSVHDTNEHGDERTTTARTVHLVVGACG